MTIVAGSALSNITMQPLVVVYLVPRTSKRCFQIPKGVGLFRSLRFRVRAYGSGWGRFYPLKNMLVCLKLRGLFLWQDEENPTVQRGLRESSGYSVDRGLREGWPTSPPLFNCYHAAVMEDFSQ